MEALEPQLPHNRAEFDQLLRRKRRWLAIGIISTLPLALILAFWIPEQYHVFVVASGFGVLAIAFAYFEFRRFQVFRRDLREQEQILAQGGIEEEDVAVQ